MKLKNYLILHEGFEKPKPEDMEAWKKWFGWIADKQVDRGGLRGGRKITTAGSEDMPFGNDSLTGYTIIEAESLDIAEEIASQCPVVTSTKVYEIQK